MIQRGWQRLGSQHPKKRNRSISPLAPVAPLILTTIPLGELLDRFLHVVF